MVLIKISEVPQSSAQLLERVSRSWKRKLETVSKQDTAVVTHRGEIVAVYKILGGRVAPHCQGRIEFVLEEIESDLKGRKIVSRTSNPCIIVEKLNFKESI
ncbi:hypothetical protein [Clostridium sp.]|uniref:hypothetical protein n=1 Tax=Clostridium sp. TaxID=1506 RepID=UPI003D6D8B78